MRSAFHPISAIVLSTLLIIHAIAQETTTPVFTPRTNSNFPTTGLITTPSSLAGTLNTNTQVATTSTSSTTTLATSQQQATQQTTTTHTTTTHTTQLTTPETIQQTTAVTTTIPQTNIAQTSTSTVPGQVVTITSTQAGGADVVVETYTLYTTEVYHSTLLRTVSTTVYSTAPVTLFSTTTELETIVVGVSTTYSHSISYSTSTTIIPRSQSISTSQVVQTDWLSTLSLSTMVLPLPSYVTDTITHIDYSTESVYTPIPVTTTGYTTSTYVTLNMTRAIFIPVTTITTTYSLIAEVHTVLSYDYSTSTGTQYATLTLSNSLWIPHTTTFELVDIFSYPPKTIVNTPVYDFLYGIPLTEYTTVTEYSPATTVYSTLTSIVTSYITSYIVDGTNVIPYTTFTVTFTSTAAGITQTTTQTQASVTLTSTSISTRTTSISASPVTVTSTPAVITVTSSRIVTSTTTASVTQVTQTPVTVTSTVHTSASECVVQADAFETGVTNGLQTSGASSIGFDVLWGTLLVVMITLVLTW